MAKNNRHKNWKKREGVVYSTNDEFEYSKEKKSVESDSQYNDTLHVYFTKKGRGGKIVTIITGFTNNFSILSLAQLLKQHCGVGGTVKNNEIILQGDVVDKVKVMLSKKGYHLKGQ